MTYFINSTDLPVFIPVDIDFCSLASGLDESICSIQESEFGSKNKIFLDHAGNNPKIMIDKRNITPEKAQFLFEGDKISIGKQNIINLPYAHKSILIRPGEYHVEKTNQGYLIVL